MGNITNSESSGGGRIVITADSLFLNGSTSQIQANARPYSRNSTANSLSGGSGGYIYIQTSNRFAPNLVNSTVEAKGGSGNGNGFGGSGGIIVFDGNFSLDMNLINAAGG